MAIWPTFLFLFFNLPSNARSRIQSEQPSSIKKQTKNYLIPCFHEYIYFSTLQNWNVTHCYTHVYMNICICMHACMHTCINISCIYIYTHFPYILYNTYVYFYYFAFFKMLSLYFNEGTIASSLSTPF